MPIAQWGATYPNIAPSASWVWYDSGNDTSTSLGAPAPLRGFNHDEFLVFRVAGAAVPEPATWLLATMGLAGMVLCGWKSRRRAS